MNEVMDVFMSGVISLLGSVVTVAVGIITYKITKWGNKYINNQNTKLTTQQKQAVVNSTVAYVEQVFKDIDGAQKLEEAKNKILTLLQEQGITITDEEMQVLIEAAVVGLKQGQNKAEEETK